MKSFEFLTAPMAQAIGWALLHLLWQGALVGGIAAAGLALLRNRSANARYALACAALAVLPVMFAATAVRSYEAPLPVERMVAQPAPRGLESPRHMDAVAPAPAPLLPRMMAAARTHLPEIVLLWLVGVTVLSLRLGISWLRALRLARRAGRPAPAPWQRALGRLAGALQLRRAVQLLESAAVEVPTVIGWLRPVVLVPATALSGLSPQQLEMVLAHELAHIRRHDFLVNLLQAVVETLMFYHPAVWWMSRRVRIERENCCDDLAVAVCGNALQYARALTRLEELRGMPQVALAANGGSLLGRVRRLVSSPSDLASAPPRWTAGLAVLAALLIIVGVPATPLFARREEPAKPAAKAKPASKPKATTTVTRNGNATTTETRFVSADGHRTEVTRQTVTTDDEPSGVVVDVDVEAPTPPPTPVVAPTPMAAPAPMAAPPAPIVTVTPRPAIAPIPTPRVRIRMHPGHVIGANGQLTVDDLITLRANGVTGEYVQQMRELSLGQVSLNDILALRVQGVTPEYVRGLRDAGVDLRKVDDVIALRVQGISPKYIKELADAGYRNLSADDLISLRVQGVSASLIKALSEAGYKNLSVKELVRLAAHGVDAEYIRDIAKYKQ